MVSDVAIRLFSSAKFKFVLGARLVYILAHASQRGLWLAALLAVWSALGNAENLAKDIKKAVERCTLDQPGTEPFHLKATIAPSFERDDNPG